MKVKRTIPVKLDVPKERREDLHQTIQQFNTAANYTVENGRNEDGDFNAAKNIGLKLLTLPEGKRSSGLGDGQLALKSGTLNLSDDYSSAEFRPEGESHGQAHDFNRG